MGNYDEILREIKEEGIFERFKELKPFKGVNYINKNHSKLLLVGESNYFEDELESESDFKFDDKWYQGKNRLLIPKKKEGDVDNAGKVFHLKGLLNSMQKLLNTAQYDDIAFYNYFLRPASVKNKKGERDLGFKKDYTDLDGEVAFIAFCEILESFQPDIVIFASSLAWNKMEVFRNKYKKKFDSIVIKKVSHPSSPWWNKSGGVYGHQKFENILIDHYWVNRNPMNEIVFQKLKTIHNLLLNKFQKAIYKPSNCGIWDGNYLSCLYLQVEDKTFCCQTGVTINDINFWTCFYKTENSKEIPALEGKDYNFTPEFSNDIVVDSIEKLINQITEEVSKKAKE